MTGAPTRTTAAWAPKLGRAEVKNRNGGFGFVRRRRIVATVQSPMAEPVRFDAVSDVPSVP